MQLHDLKPAKGAHRRPERVGRGTGSGRGKTSGRGQKGQNARSQGFRLGFEGGQMPFSQRVPKLPGFKNPFKKLYTVVNVSKLSRFADGSKVGAEALLEAGLIKGEEEIKILGTGRLKRRLTVEAHAFSNSAREAIEKAGGSVTILCEPRTIGPRRTAAKAPRQAGTSQPKAGDGEERTSSPESSSRAGKSRPKGGDGEPEPPTTA